MVSAIIEFIVQFLVLRQAPQQPQAIFYSDNIRQLGVLGALGILPPADVRRLQDVYREYRHSSHRLALDGQPAMLPTTAFTDERGFVRKLWQDLLVRGSGEARNRDGR